jgi:hypothetical protein
MAEIGSIIIELKELNNELKIRNEEMKKLKKRKKEIEESLCKFFEEKKQPGIKYKGMAVVAEDKTGRMKKKKAEKTQDCINVLKHYNIHNAEKIYNELMETMKGDEISKKTVKIIQSNSQFNQKHQNNKK